MCRRTGGVDNAVRPGGVPECFKALRDVLHGRRLALYAVQQRLDLWAQPYPWSAKSVNLSSMTLTTCKKHGDIPPCYTATAALFPHTMHATLMHASLACVSGTLGR